MTSVVFYFQVHQPFRLRRYTFFDIGHRHDYFDDIENARIIRRVADKCYKPMTELLTRMVERWNGRFRVAFSISGTALDQMELWSPETLAAFQKLVATGAVELLCETAQHSLAALFDVDEFRLQVMEQRDRIERLFGQRPTTFRNTELVISNAIARTAEELGFSAILGEGADHLLGWRSPHYVYRPEGSERMKLLLRSYQLTDDIAFRFSNRGWSEWPLTADKWTQWLENVPPNDECVCLFMDYETFGEHQWRDTGIFEFMEHLPERVLRSGRFAFQTPREVVTERDAVGRLDIPHPVSWADTERDLTAWLGNHMQRSAAQAVYALARQMRGANAHDLLTTWCRLTTSDHLYYMCTKWFSDGDVHKYFSPYTTPHDAFIAFMNVLDDLSRRVAARSALTGTTPTVELGGRSPSKDEEQHGDEGPVRGQLGSL